MNVRTVLLCLICGAPLFAADAGKNDPSGIEIVLRRLEHLKFDAQQRKDTTAFGSMLDDAIIWVEPSGTLTTKAAYLAGLRDPNRQLLRVLPESMTVKVFDGVAIVVGIYDERGVKAGHPYHVRCRFIDTWAFKKATWVCIAATATSVIS